ncbi:MAG: thioredoxin-dependent thiol peroxidase [Nanoarchaeota archaeon]
MLKEGSKAPDFALCDQDGKRHTLADYRGRKVVLYFYPKDDTPGCTKEACTFRDDVATYKKKGAVVIGVSADSAESHVKFRTKYSLPFTLLSDPGHDVLKKYHVWGQKSMYGKIFMGITRATYVIDEKGIVMKAFDKVKVEGHSAEILATL